MTDPCNNTSQRERADCPKTTCVMPSRRAKSISASAKKHAVGDSEASLFAFHVAARLHTSGCLVCAREQGIPARLRPVRGCHADEKEHGHRRPDGPAMFLRSRHPAKRVGEARGDGEDGEHLYEVGERRRVLKRVRAVGVEESAAVRAPHLDRFLRSHGPLRDCLLRDNSETLGAVFCRPFDCLRLDESCRISSLEILHDSLRDEQERDDKAERQQQPEDGAHHVNPEVAECFHFTSSDSSNEGDGYCDADGCGDEVLISQPRHLRQVTHHHFGRVCRSGFVKSFKGQGYGAS